MRDMQHIMKLPLLLPFIQGKESELRDEFNKIVTDDLNRAYWAAPFSMMENADRLFKRSCEHKLWSWLAKHVEQVIDHLQQKALAGETCDGTALDPATAMDVTWTDLVAWVDEEFKFLDPLPRSTSLSHNHAEAQMLATVMDFRRDRLYFWSLQRRAQEQDYEYREWEAEQAKLHRAELEREREQAERTLAEQRQAEARRAVKKLVRGVASPHVINKDALVGWPTLDDVDRVRNEQLKAYLLKVHGAYYLTESGDIRALPPKQIK